jgi:hypothetical protein
MGRLTMMKQISLDVHANGINCSPKDANLVHSKSSSRRGIFRKIHAQLVDDKCEQL